MRKVGKWLFEYSVGMVAVFLFVGVLHALGPDTFAKGYCGQIDPQFIAERIIEKSLEFPDSAKFVYGRDDRVSKGKEDCQFVATGHVDADTEGGFKRRVTWEVGFVMTNEGNISRLDYLQLDGKRKF